MAFDSTFHSLLLTGSLIASVVAVADCLPGSVSRIGETFTFRCINSRGAVQDSMQLVQTRQASTRPDRLFRSILLKAGDPKAPQVDLVVVVK